jgi:predicted RNase H-like nuclease (RuvC/YqgF family)
MPTETEVTAVETTETETQGAKPNATETTTEQDVADFEAWLEKQPEQVKKAYEKHTSGLKTALEKERATNKKHESAAQKAQREAEEAKLGEIEKRDKRIKELEEQAQQYAAKQRALDARDALLVQAEKAKIAFASKVAEQDAIKFALDLAEYDEDGAIKNAKAALESAVKDRQYLIQQAPPAPETNGAKRGTSKTTPDPEHDAEVRRRFRIN